MFKCPTCGNEDEFSVMEFVRQKVRISCYSDGFYSVNETTYYEVQEWDHITCLDCQTVHAEEILREAFASAVDDPIPYTLVDASTT